MCSKTQVQGLPGALPAQMVRPTAGTVTWLLDADSAAGVAPEKWSDDPKAYPRRCVVISGDCQVLNKPTLVAELSLNTSPRFLSCLTSIGLSGCSSYRWHCVCQHAAQP